MRRRPPFASSLVPACRGFGVHRCESSIRHTIWRGQSKQPGRLNTAQYLLRVGERQEDKMVPAGLEAKEAVSAIEMML